MMTFLILLILGLVAGVLAGLFGIGGGILFTPILFVLLHDAEVSDPVLWTIGSSLFCTFIAAGGSSVQQYQQDNFYGKEGVRVGLLGVIGVSLGKQVITSPYYSQAEFVVLFSMVLIYVSYMFYRRGRGRDDNGDPKMEIGLKKAGITGGAGGFIAALAGIGGGGVMVPVMNLGYKTSFRKAVSVSSLAIVFISLGGWMQLGFTGPETGEGLTAYNWGYVDFGAALPLAVAGLIGGLFGASLNLKIDRRHLQYGFSLLAISMAVKLIAEVF